MDQTLNHVRERGQIAGEREGEKGRRDRGKDIGRGREKNASLTSLFC